MNKQTQEALKMAIEALDKLARLGNGDSYGNSDGNCIAIKTLKAIEEALEQPAQKPYGWYDNHDIHTEKQSDESIALYTHPHQWQGLTDDEIDKIYYKTFDTWSSQVDIDFAHAIEQALKEKNHG
jgi:hypothetical protein